MWRPSKFPDVYFSRKDGLSAVLRRSIARLRTSEWDAVFGKGSSGKHDLESSPRVGCTFPMGLQAETASRNARSERDALSGSTLKRKLQPGFQLQNGTYFPDGVSDGNCIPEFGSRVGCAFLMGLQAETASQNSAPERDTFSGRGLKRHPRPRIRNGIEAQFMSARAATLTAT